MAPSKFIFAQDTNPPIDGVNPPIDTGSPTTTFTMPTDVTYGVPSAELDFAVIGIVILLVCGILSALWYYFDSQRKVKLADIRPSTSNMSSSEVSLNKAAFMQMLPYMPPLIGITPVLILARTEPMTALAILIGLVSLPALMYMYMAKKSLEENKGKVNMAGFLRTEDGDRESYFWRNVTFKSEKHLTDEELDEIDNAKVIFREKMIQVLADRDAKIAKIEKKSVREALEKALNDSQYYWTQAEIEDVHAIPIQVDGVHDAFLMSRSLNTEWEFVKGEDYDYYGYHDVLITGPELRKISTVHRVIELESEEYRDEYCPIFLVMYDDKMSKDALSSIAPIDVTRDHAVAGICKAVGAEERTAAGELNSITEQVMVLENQDKDLDDLSQTIGRKKAIDFINAEKRLTLFDVSMMGSVSTIVAIVFAVISFLLGHSMGAGG